MLTVPNALTLLRLVLLVVFAVLVLGENAPVAGAALLGVAGVTDFLDGYVARHFDQESELGKILDPTVDRILLITAVAVIVASGALPVWITVLVLAREAVVAGAALVLAARRAERIDVIFIGKAGTFGLMVCLPLLLAGSRTGALAHGVRLAAEIGAVPSLALAYAAAAAYVPAARRALAGARRGPSPATGVAGAASGAGGAGDEAPVPGARGGVPG